MHIILDKFELQPDWTEEAVLEHLKCPCGFIMALR